LPVSFPVQIIYRIVWYVGLMNSLTYDGSQRGL